MQPNKFEKYIKKKRCKRPLFHHTALVVHVQFVDLGKKAHRVVISIRKLLPLNWLDLGVGGGKFCVSTYQNFMFVLIPNV